MPRITTHVSRPVGFLAAAALVLAAGNALGQCDPATNFGAPVTLPSGALPLGIASGDLNNDGNMDVVTANFFGGSGTAIFGNGDGTFNPGVDLPMVAPGDTSAVGVVSVDIGDVNNDGWNDIAFAVQSIDLGSPGVALLLNDGAGNFPGLPTFFGFSIMVRGIEIVDLNNDGNADIIYGDRDDDSVNVALGNGDGTFGAVTSTVVSGGTTGFVVRDFNLDGHLDVAASLVFSAEVVVLAGDSTGSLTELSRFAVGSPEGIGSADMNGDGNEDLVIPFTNGSQIEYYLGNGNGTFGAIHAIATPFSLVADARDVNGDGFADLLVGLFLDSSVEVHLSNGAAGTFAAPNTFAIGDRPRGLTFADFNNDGTDDLAAANGATTGSATVLINACATAAPCPGDIADDFGTIGADGMVSFGDFLALLGLVGPCPGMTPGCDGDIADDFGTLNGGDGMVSFGDFLALLGLVGPCP